MLRVWEGKSKPRETPVPSNVATTVRTVDDYRDEDSDVPVVDKSTRTLRRWIDRVGDDLAERAEVDAMLVCDWDGWSDLETFLDRYRGKFSPEAQRKQRIKVDWL